MTTSDFAMTVGQRVVWRDVRRTEPDQMAGFNISQCWPLPQGTTETAVRRAVAALAVRHETLRTRFVRDAGDSEPRQTLDPPLDEPVEFEVDMATFAVERFEQDRRHGFDVATEHAWSATLCRTTGGELVLCVAFHHLVADLPAVAILRREFMTLLSGVAVEDLATALQPRSMLDAGSESAVPLPLRESIEALPVIDGAVDELAGPPTLFAARPVSDVGILRRLRIAPSALYLGLMIQHLGRQLRVPAVGVAIILSRRRTRAERTVVATVQQPYYAIVPTGQPGENVADTVMRMNELFFGALEDRTYDAAQTAEFLDQALPGTDLIDRFLYFNYLPPEMAVSAGGYGLRDIASTMQCPTKLDGPAFDLRVNTGPDAVLTVELRRYMLRTLDGERFLRSMCADLQRLN